VVEMEEVVEVEEEDQALLIKDNTVTWDAH